MNRKTSLIVVIAILSIGLTSCVPLTPPAQNQVSEAYIQTAVASTLIAERAKEAGAALSVSETQENDLTETPEEQETEVPEDTLEPQPTVENPWLLQSWCLDNEVDCEKYGVRNTTDSWLQIELKKSDTGVTGFFSIQKKTMSQITLIPGQYSVKYTWWCDGEAASLSVVKSLGSWIDVFDCPKGFIKRINKP